MQGGLFLAHDRVWGSDQREALVAKGGKQAWEQVAAPSFLLPWPVLSLPFRAQILAEGEQRASLPQTCGVPSTCEGLGARLCRLTVNACYLPLQPSFFL